MAPSTGIPGLITPYSTSEFRDFVEKVRQHHWATAGQMREIAGELRYELIKHLRDQADVGRANARIIARRVTRPLIVASRLDYDVARNALRSYNVYLDLVVDRGKPRTHGRGFDPNK